MIPGEWKTFFHVKKSFSPPPGPHPFSKKALYFLVRYLPMRGTEPFEKMMGRAGCRVIPTVSWADADSYEYCFDGITPGGTVAVSTVGAMYSKACRSLFFRGFEAMTARLKPKTIIVYGGLPAGVGSEKYEIISYPNTSLAWKTGCRGVSYGEKR